MTSSPSISRPSPRPLPEGEGESAKHTSPSCGLLRFDETHAATPKGNLKREAASNFQTRRRGIHPGPSNKLPIHFAVTKHARHKFRAALHTKLYKDIAEMKLHRLFAHLQTCSDRRIR